jgi:hypothetical protein
MKQRPLKNTSENKLNKDRMRSNGEKKKKTKLMVQQPVAKE